MIKIIFFGTPYYVLPILDSVKKNFNTVRDKGLIGVVTQNPKPAGRGNQIEYSAVDHWAYKNNVDKYYDMSNLPYADIGIVASYGKIIPKSVIENFKYGILNVHPSRLPKYRGASPVQSTIVSGDTETGVTIIKMDEKLDHGPIVSKFTDSVLKDDDADTLRDRLFERSADFLVNLIPSYIESKIKPKPQDHNEASFTTQINKSDAYINPVYLNKLLKHEKVEEKISLQFIKESSFVFDAYFLDRFIRAMNSWPVAWTDVTIGGNKKRLKILKSHIENDNIVIDLVQLEGKSPIEFSQFKQGYKDAEFK